MDQVTAEVRKVIIGQEDAIRYSLVAILCNQHALIEGVPGLAKTLLARTLAAVMDAEFKRIQFTPDLMPADITGNNVFNLQRNEFSLVKGPIFTTFLLADEINRAPAKTQSALLEAMQERTVTIDRESHRLSPNFTVFATQNPIESEGTYPLPEAQKDRFMLKISMTWPESDEELSLAQRSLGNAAPEQVLRPRGNQCPPRGGGSGLPADGGRDRHRKRPGGGVRRPGRSPDAHRRQHSGGRRSARHAGPVARRPGLGRAGRPRFRQPRRYPGRRAAGHRAPPAAASRIGTGGRAPV